MFNKTTGLSTKKAGEDVLQKGPAKGAKCLSLWQECQEIFFH
jgi:hypothetical protein